MRTLALLGIAALSLTSIPPAVLAGGTIPFSECRVTIRPTGDKPWRSGTCQGIAYASDDQLMGIGFQSGTTLVNYFYRKGNPSQVIRVSIRRDGDTTIFQASGECSVDKGILGCWAYLPETTGGILNVAALTNPSLNYLHYHD